MPPAYRTPPRGPRVDYDQVLDWVRRHNSGNYYEVVDRFADFHQLSKLDRARLKRLLEDREKRHAAARALLEQQRGA